MTETGALPAASPGPIVHSASADFAIGVASYNNAATIGSVLASVHQGLRHAFPSATTVIIHADGGSRDGTPGVAREAVPGAADLVQITYEANPALEVAGLEGLPGRPAALRGIFELARSLQVRGVAVIDANVTSVTPEWIGRLARPITVGDADFVAPYYVRHRFDSAMTNGIAYPLIRALYGKRIRYPLMGEFACSARLLDHYLGRGAWPAELARAGSDIWLVTQALCGGFRFSQAFLGVRTQVAPDTAADLGERHARVLAALFLELERNVSVWQKIRGSEPVPLRGELPETAVEPVAVDAKRGLDSFRLGQKNLSEVWGLVLPPGSLLALRKLAQQPDATFRFPDELWARTVYDFALAYRTRVMNRDHLLSAFTPLFIGWFGSFVAEVENAEPARVEQRIEQLCLRYEAEKPYLISRWRWPDRFYS